jgi:DNA-binding response OmpR family regulator
MSTVLLVADDAWVRNDVEGSLADPTTKVVTVADPRSVVTEAVRLAPDLFLVDMQVGSMGGMAVTRALKDAFGSGVLVRVPIVLLLDRSADEFLAKRAAADAWVLKPFSAQALRAARDRAAVAAAAG